VSVQRREQPSAREPGAACAAYESYFVPLSPEEREMASVHYGFPLDICPVEAFRIIHA
jgi:hypothetical protein